MSRVGLGGPASLPTACPTPTRPLLLLSGSEVNISSYPATDVAGSLFFSSCRNIKFRGFCAEIFRSGDFVQKYWSVIAARYCYVLSSHAPQLFGFDQTKPSCSENDIVQV